LASPWFPGTYRFCNQGVPSWNIFVRLDLFPAL
jgi:hypothetical protein